MKKIRKSLCLMLLSFLIASCAPNQTGVTNISTPPTATSTSQSTRQIQTPSVSAIPSPTISSTPEPTATSFVTNLIKTLTPVASGNRITELIKNPTCDLPCWWGVIPGATDWTDVQSLLSYLNISSKSTNDVDYIKHAIRIPGSEYPYETGVDAFEKEGKIDYLAAWSFLSPLDLQRTWSAYDPKSILNRYGPPSRALIYAQVSGEGPGPAKPTYILMLFYDEQGFMIHYGGEGQNRTSSGIQVCPDFTKGKITGVGILMQSKDVTNPVELPPTNQDWRDSYFIIRPDLRSIKTAAGLDIDEFRSLFVGENPSYCFTVNYP